jgi:hypothetical protein
VGLSSLSPQLKFAFSLRTARREFLATVDCHAGREVSWLG